MRSAARRSGVASVIGTMLFVLVLLAAIGAQEYTSGLQAQSDQASQQALGLADQRGLERLVFTGAPSALSAGNGGPVTARVVGLILRFPNGTVFSLPASASIPQGGTVGVQQLVPSTGCGATSCVRRYAAVVAGSVQGGEVGLATSMGNVFWYLPSALSGTGSVTYWTAAAQSTASQAYVPVAGLSFSLAQGARYVVTVVLGYYQSSQASPGMVVGASVPVGTTMLGCGGLEYPDVAVTCTASPNTSLGNTVFAGNTINPPCYCTSSTAICYFSASVNVWVGAAAGTFQLEFEAPGQNTVTVSADSVMAVAQAG